MKKILSALIALGMMLSMTAFAANTAKLSMTADKSTAKVGEQITYTISISKEDDNKLFTASTVVLSYPTDKIAIDEGAVLAPFDSYKTHKFQDVAKSGRFTMQIMGDTSGNPDSIVALDEAKTLCTFKATVKEGATGDITFTINSAYSTVAATAMGAKERTDGIELPTVAIVGDDPTPSKPVITLDPSNPVTGENNGIVDINTDAETGAYSVKVTAPIGKKAVIYLNGEAQATTEISGTATADTTIKVEYVDVADEVITYVVPMSSIYGAEETGIAAFGKGTIAEGVAYGIKFGGLTGTYKDITDYKFPAKGNVGGIFGVEVKDAPAGNYTAQAYVGDAMGAAIDFTK